MQFGEYLGRAEELKAKLSGTQQARPFAPGTPRLARGPVITPRRCNANQGTNAGRSFGAILAKTLFGVVLSLFLIENIPSAEHSFYVSWSPEETPDDKIEFEHSITL